MNILNHTNTQSWSNPIDITSQYHHEGSNNPCTGFAFACVSNKDLICEHYTNYDTKAYSNMISFMLETAIQRKRLNPQIHYEGEFLNDATIIADYSDIHAESIWIDFSIVNDQRLNPNEFLKFMRGTIFNLQEFSHIIINRGGKTFAVIVTAPDVYLVIDSHKSMNGWVNIDELIKYILCDMSYAGNIEILYSK